MEQIKIWAFSICLASVCGAILNMLAPEGNFLKTFKCIISIFFLCVVIAPIFKTELPDFSSQEKIFSEENIETYEENGVDKITEEVFEEQIESETEKILSEKELAFEDISVKVNILEDGSIDINKFTITFYQNVNFDSLKEELRQKIGIEPKIVVSGENENGNT